MTTKCQCVADLLSRVVGQA